MAMLQSKDRCRWISKAAWIQTYAKHTYIAYLDIMNTLHRLR